MKIIAHRGLWSDHKEKNTLVAFKRAFLEGFGIETDIRDHLGRIVISHNIPSGESLDFRYLLELYNNINPKLKLALNIKADCLQDHLKNLLIEYEIENYFVFDMSVPDGLIYIDKNFNTFTRMSEFELQPSFYNEACGVWLDEFKAHWITKTTIEHNILNNKQVCIVSPELHKREYLNEWLEYKNIAREFKEGEIMICTDYPIEARELFNE